MTVAEEAIHALSRAMHELEAAVAEAEPLLGARHTDRGGRILLRADGWLRGQAPALLVRGTTLRAAAGRGESLHSLHIFDQEVRRACRELSQLTTEVHEAYAAATQDVVREMDASRASFDALAERAQHAWREAEDLVAQLTEVYGDSTPPPKGLAAPLRELLLALQVQKKHQPSNVAAEFSDSERRVRAQFDPDALTACQAIVRRLREAVDPVEHALSRLREAHDATLGDLTAKGVLDAEEAIHALSRAMHELEAAVAEAEPLLGARHTDRRGRILLRADGWLRGQAPALLVRGTTLRAAAGRGESLHSLHIFDQEVRRACRELSQLTTEVREAYAAATQDVVREMDASRASFDALAERAQHAWREAEDLVAQLTEVYGDSTPPPKGLAAPLRELLLALQVQKKHQPSNVAAEFSDSERRVRAQLDPAALTGCQAIIRRLREAVEPVEHALSRLREAQHATLGDLTATGVLDDKEEAEREFEHAASIAAGTVRLVADAAATLEGHFERLRRIDVPADRLEPLAGALQDTAWRDIVLEATDWADRCAKILALRQPRCDGGALTPDTLRTLVSTVLSWLGLATAADGVNAARELRLAAEDFENRALRAIVVATRVSVRAARLAAFSRRASPQSLDAPHAVQYSEPSSSSVRELEPRTAGDVSTLATCLMDEQAAIEATLRILADRLSLAREELSMPHECTLTRAAERTIETRLADSHLVDLSVKITGLVKDKEPTAPLHDPRAAKEWLTLLSKALQRHGARCLSITDEIRDALAVIAEDVAHGAGWQARDWNLVCSAPRQARALLLARQRLQQRRNDNAVAAANACRESQTTLASWLDQCGLAFPRELRDLDAQLRVTMSGARHPARRVAAVQSTLDAALGNAEAASGKQLSVAWASIERKAWQSAAAVARSRHKRKLSTICDARALSVVAVEMTRRRDIQQLAEARSLDDIHERAWACVPTARPMIEATFATSRTDDDDMLSLVIDDDARSVLARAESVFPAGTPASDSLASMAAQSELSDPPRSHEAAANAIPQSETEPEPSSV